MLRDLFRRSSPAPVSSGGAGSAAEIASDFRGGALPVRGHPVAGERDVLLGAMSASCVHYDLAATAPDSGVRLWKHKEDRKEYFGQEPFSLFSNARTAETLLVKNGP